MKSVLLNNIIEKFRLLRTTLVVRVMRSVRCVRLYFRTISFEGNDLGSVFSDNVAFYDDVV